jgi:signal transduction histidine kinase
LSVGLYVAFATAVVFLVSAAVIIVIAVRRSVVAPRDMPAHPGGFGQPIQANVRYLDTASLLTAVVVLAIAGVIALGLVGWLVSQRAVKPLADALTLQRHFVADASHELRTPLTVLNSRVQVLQRRLARGDDVAKTAAQLREDTERMNDVLNDLLLTAEGTTLPGVVTAVTAAVREAVASLQPMADQAAVALSVEAAADLRVGVPARSLTRAVVALVDNAIQHSAAGGEVAVAIVREGAEAAIRVRDRGSGIAPETADRIFERFAHGRETGRKRSFGLGLALVSEIAQRFGGDIAVETTGSDGTVFLLRFPLAR